MMIIMMKTIIIGKSSNSISRRMIKMKMKGRRRQNLSVNGEQDLAFLLHLRTFSQLIKLQSDGLDDD